MDRAAAPARYQLMPPSTARRRQRADKQQPQWTVRFAFITAHWSQRSASPCSVVTWTVPRLPRDTSSCHHPPLDGASVPISNSRSGLSGLPCAVRNASYINSPDAMSQAPGSSPTTSGTPTSPKAFFALLLITRSAVPLARCRTDILVLVSTNLHWPPGSSHPRTIRKHWRACSRLPASKTTSAPGLWSGSPGVSALANTCAANVDLPLPLGIESAAVSTPGASARARNRR